MNLIMNFKIFNTFAMFFGLILSSCSTGTIKQTRDICKIEKHWRDNVFRVLINGKPINKHYYIHSEAIDITKKLASENKCMD